MRTCTRILELDYGHRVLGHTDSKGNPGKCSSLHGHRGKVEITCSCESLNEIGVVIDFGRVKEIVGGWIDTNWDHTMILNSKDPMLDSEAFGQQPYPLLKRQDIFGPNKPYILNGVNPTAENLAEELFKVSTVLLKPHGIKVQEVVFWETPNCFSRYTSPIPNPLEPFERLVRRESVSSAVRLDDDAQPKERQEPPIHIKLSPIE